MNVANDGENNICHLKHNMKMTLIKGKSSETNLYEVSRVTVLTFRPKNQTQEITICPLSVSSYDISI